jgi:hypothetical protein
MKRSSANLKACAARCFGLGSDGTVGAEKLDQDHRHNTDDHVQVISAIPKAGRSPLHLRCRNRSARGI